MYKLNHNFPNGGLLHSTSTQKERGLVRSVFLHARIVVVMCVPVYLGEGSQVFRELVRTCNGDDLMGGESQQLNS